MSECIDHGRAGNSKGYAFSKVDGKSVGLHRKALLDAGIEIPDGHVAMHACDNPRCINIEHLSVGTYRQNMVDALSKDRLTGSQAGVTEYAVRWIRSLWTAGGRTQQELADLFGLNQSAISKIVNRKTWRHVT